jgi:hypothetical protein
MGLRQRISGWRGGDSEARKKRDARRRQRSRADAAAAEQKALAKGEPKRRAATKPGRTASGDARKVGSEVPSIGVEVAKLAREMVVIPLHLWLAAAEVAGRIVLGAWLRFVLPVLRALGRAGAAALRLGERHVTPARGVTAVGLVAIGALAASQWLDYRSISIGADAYSDAVGSVAPPPQVDSDIAGHAHGWVMLPLALLALVAVVVAATSTRRRRIALALVPIGIAVVAISLAVDAPKGLDEGEAALAYEGATASLLQGFWMQIVTGSVLIACGVMLPLYLRPARATVVTGPSPAAVIAGKVKAAVGRVPRPRLRPPNQPRRRPTRRRAKRKVQGAGT